MENETNELTHWGIKGMKWGLRRYQNKDGSLTPAGRKRYNKELEKLEQKQATLKNKQATKAKLDKLDELKRDIDARKATLKGKPTAAKIELDPDKQAALKAKILNSTDPKELYKHRDLLTTAEINERLTRLDTEKRLGAAAEGKKTDLATRLEKINNIGQKANNLYNTINGPIGKLIREKLGFGKKETKFNLDEKVANLENLSEDDVQKVSNYLKNMRIISANYKEFKSFISGRSEAAIKRSEEAQKEANKEASKVLQEEFKDTSKRLRDAKERVSETTSVANRTGNKTDKEAAEAAKREFERAQNFYEDFIKNNDAAKWLL